MLCRFTDTLLDPSISNTIRICKRLGVSISKTGIRERFLSRCKMKERITIKDIVEVLAGIGVTVKPARISGEYLGKIQPPYMLLVEKKDEAYFCLAEEAAADTIKLFDPYTNVITSFPITHFAGSDRIILAVSKYDPQFIEENYAANKEAEDAADEAYKATVRVYPGVLTPEECDEIVAYYDNHRTLMERSQVDRINSDGKTWVEPSYSRTCDVSLFSHFQKSNTYLERIAALLDSSTDKFETPSILRYDVGQEFKNHHDAFNGDERKNTVLVYLNDDFVGGETYLPEIDLKITPKKGACLVFGNIFDDLTIIPQSLHSSLPIISGVKYALITLECRNSFTTRKEDDLVEFNKL
jgi:hypothetical protein